MTGGVTLGVLGHVDHGKTALVRALTGIETDRLPEERERGLSIVLGFSFLETDRGVVDLIDAPGHEDFIRAMVAGATGIDAVMLCVAADEGVAPQTVEHFDIANLLNVGQGLIAITKVDRSNEGGIAGLRRDIAGLVAGSPLAEAPIVECSAVTGDGIESLKAHLVSLAGTGKRHEPGDGAFLPVDRLFTRHGFGVIVTGTLRHGEIGVGERIVVQPAGHEASVRGIEVHGRAVEIARPGQRVALNLRGVELSALDRGDVVATPDLLRATRRVDGEVSILPTAEALTNGVRVRLLCGATAVTATARLLGCDAIEPGSSGLVQWRLEREIATHRTERYIIRRLSPAATLGGGRVLAVNPRRHRRFDDSIVARLTALGSGDLEGAVRSLLADARDPVAVVSIGDATGHSEAEIRDVLPRCDAVEIRAGFVVADASIEALAESVTAGVEGLHAGSDAAVGFDVAAISREVGIDTDSELLRHVVDRLVDQGTLLRNGSLLCLREHDALASLTDRQRDVYETLDSLFGRSGLEPPDWRQLVGSDPIRKAMLKMLIESGRVVRLRTYDRKASQLLHAAAIEAAMASLAERYPYPEAFAVKDARDVLGSTRRFIVPLLEHFDAIGATERNGNLRRLRQR